jgi:uncharacterized peroxidase-related enzyme
LLRQLTHDDALTDAILAGHRTASLSPADRALLDYLAKLTLRPAEMTVTDTQELRGHDLSDEEIVHAISVCALYNHNDRIADACGLTGDGL